MELHFKYLVITGLLGLATLLIGEAGYRRKLWHGEGARKFVHMLVGIQVAIWPLYLSWDEIRIISIVLTIGFLVCMKLKVFHSIRSVARLSYGEILFIITIGALTLFTTSEAKYAAAILHLSLADGMAALIGTRYGRTTGYTVAGSRKSLIGSAAFLFVSLAILIGYSLLSNAGLAWEYIVLGAIVATVLENFGTLGIDNITVPVWILVLLMYIA